MSAISPMSFDFWKVCPLFGSQAIPTTAGVTTLSVVDSSKVSNWLIRVGGVLPRLERIAQNGALSLLEKEIQNITPLLREGQEMGASLPQSTMTVDMIDRLIKPRLDQLQQSYASAQKKVSENAEIKSEDEKIEKKWAQLGLPASILEDHIDCARFLIESALAFKIVGFRETCRNPDMHDVKLDNDGHPMIKVQGAFKRWELIKQQLAYDSKTDQIRSRNYLGSIVQNWTYLSPDGLVPIDRLNHDRIVPIYRLSAAERQRVMDQARKFYETNREVDQGIPKDWVVQFHTSPRRQFVSTIPPFPENPLLDNFVKNLNTHIVMRLIAPNGEVYSFGIEMPAESQEFLWEDGMAKFLGTVTAKINKAGDYEEFRPHVGRIVTSIPLTAQRADNIINLINTTGDIRFNFLRQNCSNLMNIVLKQAGYDIATETTVKDFLVDILPDVKHIPVIGPVIDKINQFAEGIFSKIASATPEPIKNAVSLAGDVVFYIPRKIGTLAINLLIKYLGGATMLHELPPGTEEEELYNAGRFLNFSRLIRSWTDLFKEQTLELYHSKYFVDWQKQQRSTFVEPGSLLPKLAIVPPVA
ncbi:MAG: hypothetical protein JSS60_04245 [Verrucomicrobia bacterium]|nr:hypothetical protein [Verrucomicrobiota bacterium]